MMTGNSIKYVLTAREMQACDLNTINHFGLSADVLMERASCFVARQLMDVFSSDKSGLFVCGVGNNGGDGVCTARILALRGYDVKIRIVGDIAKASEGFLHQYEIAKNYQLDLKPYDGIEHTDYIVDAIFGVGLSREVSGSFKQAIDDICKSNAPIYSIDIPSGVDATTGHILGAAVLATKTCTFNFLKRGHVLYPGKACCGQIVCQDIGITKESLLDIKPAMELIDDAVLTRIPDRIPWGHKGSFGKVLIVAGSDQMSGACYFSAKAAYLCGCGMVKIYTSMECQKIVKTMLPEAVFIDESNLQSAMKWADAILLGPGLGMEDDAILKMHQVFSGPVKPIVIDADALNLIAMHEDIKEEYMRYAKNTSAIMTPHPLEAVRLLEGVMKVEDVENRMAQIEKLAKEYCCVLVSKDADTIVTSEGFMRVNTTGNDGMGVAGSGDVLAGMIVALLASGMNAYDAASCGVYMHGLSGDYAKNKYGKRSMLTSDMLDMIAGVFQDKLGDR